MTQSRISLVASLIATFVLAGCATPPPPYDYSAFQRAKPASLLVMPPLNASPDVKATPAMWASATLPLAEAGYYVLPVTLVDETFRQNGVETADDAQNIPLPKLRDFFGADAAVYVKVTKYGTSYAVVASETRVEAEVDLDATCVPQLLQSWQNLGRKRLRKNRWKHYPREYAGVSCVHGFRIDITNVSYGQQTRLGVNRSRCDTKRDV